MKFAFKLNSLLPAFAALSWFLASMFISNDRHDYSFIWLAFFLSLAPMSFLLNKKKISTFDASLKSKISLRSFELLNSKLFILIACYVTLISFRTVSMENYRWESFYTNFFAELIPLLAYILVINRLSVDVKNFTNFFLAVIIFFVAMNAATNIIHYLTTINNTADFFTTRLGADLIGVSSNRVATNYGLTYALYAMGTMIVGMETSFVPGRIFYFFYFLIIFCALLLTQSRGSTLAFFFTAAAYIYSQRPYKLNKEFFLQCIGFMTLFLSVLGYLWWSARLGDDGLRFAVWRQGISLALRNPFFGYGENDIYVPTEAAPDEILYHGHNIIINAGLRGGVLALILMLSFIIIGFQRTFVVKQELNENIPFFWLLLFIIAGIFDFDVVLRTKGWDWVTIWPLIGIVTGAGSKIERQSSFASMGRDVG